VPSPNLDLIKRVVVVMLENRSFDHLLGYLSLPPFGWNVDGIKHDAGWIAGASSLYNDGAFAPFPLTDPYHVIPADPPHEWYNIARQMGHPDETGRFPMNGFVTNYAGAKGAPAILPADQPPVMGYFSPKQVPVTDFLAQNYAICDRWFSSLPAGTQPNRLMAMAGFTRIAVNQTPVPKQTLVYDWLNKNSISWRVYHEGLPFFSLMLEWVPEILWGTHFRPLKRLLDDVQKEPPGVFPQVIFIEPSYTDAPHHGASRDDHAPSAVKGGQEFLLEVYHALTLQPKIWKSLVTVVTYDEHGGFFDHVSPPSVQTDPPADARYTRAFSTLGVRVPSMVLSPFVESKTVYSGDLDHTSILKFLAQKFTPGIPYSDEVEKRPVGSVLDILNLDVGRTDIPIVQSLTNWEDLENYLNTPAPPAGYIPGTQPPSVIGEAFKRSLDEVRSSAAAKPTDKFGDLLQSFPPDPSIRVP
jgi:phospholipase C